jgi:hypothetical protein
MSREVFVSPLIDWTDQQMREYRAAHEVPKSSAAALLHRSGECNCGAFAKADGERAMLKALYPEFFAGIERLENEAKRAGIRWCRWGGYDAHGNRAGERSRERTGLLCEGCKGAPATPRRRRPQDMCEGPGLVSTRRIGVFALWFALWFALPFALRFADVCRVSSGFRLADARSRAPEFF